MIDSATRTELDITYLDRIYIVDKKQLPNGTFHYAYTDHKKKWSCPYIFIELSSSLARDFQSGHPRSTKTIFHELGHVHFRSILIKNHEIGKLAIRRLTPKHLTNAKDEQLFASALHLWDEYQAERRASSMIDVDDEVS